jgi:hypothetical protein
MNTALKDVSLVQAVKTILKDVHIYGVGDFITFQTGYADAPLGWGRIQQDDSISSGAYLVYNESHERFTYRQRILGYEFATANAFAYKIPDPTVDALIHSLPSSSVREILGIDVHADRSNMLPEFLDAFGSPIQAGDLVSYVTYQGGEHISIGRVSRINFERNTVDVIDITNSVITPKVFYREVALLPIPNKIRPGIQAMTKEEFELLRS